MYEDVKSSAVSTILKPEIRTEIDTQEFKSERTIKLSKGDKAKAIEIEAGDIVLTPRPYQSKPAAPKVPQKKLEESIPEEQIPRQQAPWQQAPRQQAPRQQAPQVPAPVAEEPITK